jgi:hypothetical protein
VAAIALCLRWPVIYPEIAAFTNAASGDEGVTYSIRRGIAKKGATKASIISSRPFIHPRFTVGAFGQVVRNSVFYWLSVFLWEEGYSVRCIIYGQNHLRVHLYYVALGINCLASLQTEFEPDGVGAFILIGNGWVSQGAITTPANIHPITLFVLEYAHSQVLKRFAAAVTFYRHVLAHLCISFVRSANV